MSLLLLLKSGGDVRTNLSTNPRAISGNGGWGNNNPGVWAAAFVSSGVPTHPLGITTAVQGNIIAGQTDVSAMYLYNLDTLGSGGSRQNGVWVYSAA